MPANGGLVQVFREKEMLRRLVTGVAIVCLMGGAAYAQEEEAVDSAVRPAAHRRAGKRAGQGR